MSSTSPPATKRQKTQEDSNSGSTPSLGEPSSSMSTEAEIETPIKKQPSGPQAQAKKWAPGWHSLNDLSRLSEMTVAGYLGFDDTLQLRRLMWSWPVIKGAIIFETILKNRLQANAASILDASIEDSTAYDYETDIDTLVARFNERPDEEKNDVEASILANNLMFAGTIYHVAQALEDPGLLMLDDSDLQAEFVTLRTEVANVKGFAIPQFDKSAVLMPTLGPVKKFKEHQMERYSRTFTCIRYLLYNTTASKFLPIKGKITKGTYFRSTPVPFDRLPGWMGDGPVEEVPGATAILGLMQQEKLPPIRTTIQMVRDDGTDDDDALTEHFNTFLKRKKIRWTADKVDYLSDIREFDVAPQWRDHLRNELSLPKMRCDFSTLTLFSAADSVATEPCPEHVPQEGPWIIYDNDNPDDVLPWLDVQSILRSRDSFHIEYSLKVVDTDEDGPYPYEYDGGPIQVYTDPSCVMDTTLALGKSDPFPAPPTPLAIPQEGTIDKGKGKAFENQESPIKPPAMPKTSYLEGALSGTNSHGIRGMVTPDKLFGNCKSAESKAWHLGIDVSTPAGIEMFIKRVVGSLRVANVAPKPTLKMSGLPSVVQQELQSGMEAAAETTLNADLPEISEDSPDVDSFYRTQKLFTGDESQTGPPLDACLTISDAVFESWHDQKQTLAKYTLKSLPTVKIKPLGHQITGFLWMIAKAYGIIHAPTAAGQAAADNFKTARTFGGILVDNMGLGKTFTALLYLEWVLKFHTVSSPGNYKPHLILAPAGPVIEQWRIDIQTKFKGINLVLAYGDSPPDGASAVKWLSSKAMKGYPADIKKIPGGLRYIFDRNNKMAAKTVLLTSYDTLSVRTLLKPRRQPGDDRPIKPDEWIGTWKGVFHTVILDEGHKVRNPLINIHVAVARLQARHHWFLTGTPILNQSADILGPIHILWPQIYKSLASNKDRSDWLDSLDSNYKDYELLLQPDVPRTSWKHLIGASPHRIRGLLNSREKTTINKYYRCLEQLLILRRSTATSIPLDSTGNRLSLKHLMPPHESTTVLLKLNTAEAAEYQYHHQSFVKDYEDGLAIWAQQKLSRIDPSADARSFPCVTGPLRAMTVNAVSVMLSRFHDTLKRTKVRRKRLDDTVATIGILRAQGFTGLQFAHATLRRGDRAIKDSADLLRHLTWGSPKLRWILKDVTDHCLKKRPDGGRNKLLCSEDIPVSAWYIETVLKSIYIRAEVLHAGLNDSQRIALIREFNDPYSDLTVLIMMYQVSSQGANLDGSCHRVCSITSAINLPLELQVHYRPIRVSQKNKVTIVRLSVLNTHDAWRESKQVDKSLIDVITKLHSPESFAIIADALNDSRDEVYAAHMSDAGQLALNGKKTLPLQLQRWGRNLVPDETDEDIEPSNSDHGDHDTQSLPASFTPINGATLKRKRAQTKLVPSDDEQDDTSDLTYTPPEYESDGDSFEGDHGHPDEDPGDDVAVTPTEFIADFKKSWVKLSPEDKALYDQEEMNFLILLSMDPEHIYTGEEIQDSLDSPITDRGLRLLIARRSGQTKTGLKVSPHIRYNALLTHNEENEAPFTEPEFSAVTDDEKCAAIKRFVLREPGQLNIASDLAKDVAAATLASPTLRPSTPVTEHVRGEVIPPPISPLTPTLTSAHLPDLSG